MPGKPPDTIVHQEAPLNAEPPREALAGAPITPIERFYVRNHGPVPEHTGALRIDGLVRRPLELSLDDLRALPRRELTATLQCAGNRRADLLAVRDIPGEAPWGPGATGTAALGGRRAGRRARAAGVDRAAAYVGLDRRRPLRGGRPAAELRDLDPARQGDRARGPARLGDERRAARRRSTARRCARSCPATSAPAASSGWSGSSCAPSRRDGYYQATAYRMLPEDGEPAAARASRSARSRSTATSSARRCEDGRRRARGLRVRGRRRGAWSASRCRSPAATGPQAELLEDQGEWAWRLWRATVELPPGAPRAARARVGQRGRDPAGDAGRGLEPQGLRQQRLGPDRGHDRVGRSPNGQGERTEGMPETNASRSQLAPNRSGSPLAQEGPACATRHWSPGPANLDDGEMRPCRLP